MRTDILETAQNRAQPHPPLDENLFLQSTSPAMEQIVRTMGMLAQSDVPILIVGEAGTGKQTLAEQIHRLSKARPGAFTTVQGANPQWSDEAGNEVGSWKGTVFVRDIAALGSEHQLKAMQLFFGGNGSGRADRTRLMASSDGHLEAEVRSGKFREDLFYRISAVCLYVPPLRQRKEDISMFARYFAAKYAPLLGRSANLSERLLQILTEHRWPGNIPELQHVVQTIVAIGDESIALAAIRASGFLGLGQSEKAGTRSLKQAARAASRAAERELILATLNRTRWNRKRAAQELQISYKALLYKLKQNGIAKDEAVTAGAANK